MKRNLTEKEFNEWKDTWSRAHHCPFFACSQSLFRDSCGRSSICGVLFDYKRYKTEKWIKECDIELAYDTSGMLPTQMCPSCFGSMCMSFNENGQLTSKSWCKLMNDFYENKGFPIDRSLEKYILSLGVFFIPILGEKAYLEMSEKSFEEIIKSIKEKK